MAGASNQSGAGGQSAPSPRDGGTGAAPDASANGTGGTGAGTLPETDASEAGMDAGDRCPPGQVDSHERCIPKNIYVSVNGRDDGDGSAGRPLRTFGAAMQLSQFAQTVIFGPGTWGPSESGDDFTQPIPEGVSVQGATDDVQFDGNGASLTFAGDGGLARVSLFHFRAPLVASAGTQVVTSVTVLDPLESVMIGGTANLECTSCTFEGSPANDSLPLVLVTDAATFKGNKFQVDRQQSCSYGILAVGAANVILNGGYFASAIDDALNFGSTGSLELTDMSFDTTCNLLDVNVTPPLGKSVASVEIRRSTFTQSIGINGSVQHVRIRESTFEGTTGLWIQGKGRTDDLGTHDDPGKNVFAPPSGKPDLGIDGAIRLLVQGSESVIEAYGNTWLSAQGANRAGSYDGEAGAGAVFTEGAAGPNVVVESDPAEKDAGAPSQVHL